MRFRYFLVVAASLTACTSPDTQHATPTVGQRPLPRPVEQRSATLPAMPKPVASSGLPSSAQEQAQPLPRPAPQPTTYADALPNPEELEEPPQTHAETDTSAIGSTKAAQTFWLQPGRDTVVFGKEGTTIWVPAGAFAMTTPSVSVPNGPVELQLKEFYTLPDILLNNLSTASSQGLLETGGMLHLAACASNGQSCTLKPGVELLLRMPARKPKAGMQLYKGVRTATHRLDWQRPRPALAPSEFRHDGPAFRGGEAQLLAFLRQRLAFSAEAAQHLRATQSRAQRKALRRASRYTGKRWVEYGRLLVAVDRRGAVVNATVGGMRDSMLQAQLCAAARQLPAFQPASLSGPVRSRSAAAPRSYLPIVHKRRAAPAKPLPQLPVAGIWTVEVGFSRDGGVWFPWPGIGYVNEPGGSPNQPVFSTDSARRQLRTANTQALQSASLDTLSGYLFSAASLGWANCDRTGQLGGRRIYFTVETDAPNTRLNLVFRRARAVIASDGERPGTRLQQFHASPVGERATLVAIKREQGVTYLALKDVIVGEQVEKGLPFHPVSAEELRSALAKIE